MSNRTLLYAGLAAAGAGGYYLYRAGGSPQAAKENIKEDARKAREAVPRGSNAAHAGEVAGEGVSNIDEAVNNARSQGKPDEIIPEATERGRSRIDQARRDMETSVNRFDRKVEDKTGEAKGKLSGLFGK
ncbi:hypothetical protein MAP00_002211 [Monascus purpureus]|nr:hypothetical protein MAP00_002211 [Monascus purpureus]